MIISLTSMWSRMLFGAALSRPCPAIHFATKQSCTQIVHGSIPCPSGLSTLMARAAGSSAEGELAQKRCLPCEKDSGLQALSRDAVPPLQAQLDSAWAVQEDADGRLHLHRQWRAKNFLAGLELCRRFGDVAEAEGHHPDLHLTGDSHVKKRICCLKTPACQPSMPR